ncbi:MAG: hypothetical protein WCI04_07470, partial [archaeon]
MKQKKKPTEKQVKKNLLEALKPQIKRQNAKRRNPFVTFLLIVLLCTALFQLFGNQFYGNQVKRDLVPISQVVKLYNEGKLTKVLVKTSEVLSDTKDGKKFLSYKLPNETQKDLGLNSATIPTEVAVADTESDAFWSSLISSVLPILIVFAVIIFFMRRAGGAGGGSGFGFGSSRAKLMNKKDSKTTFEQVAGCEEAKEELKEVVDFLKNPKKYIKMGA